MIVEMGCPKRAMVTIKEYVTWIGKKPLCNKDRKRAPIIFGHSFILCWRCLGLIIGGLIGSYLYLVGTLNYKNNMYFIFLLGTPFYIDTITQYIGNIESTNKKRFITGVLLGVALANFRPF